MTTFRALKSIHDITVFLGVSHYHKGFKCLNKDDKIFISKYVSLMNSSFPILPYFLMVHFLLKHISFRHQIGIISNFIMATDTTHTYDTLNDISSSHVISHQPTMYVGLNMSPNSNIQMHEVSTNEIIPEIRIHIQYLSSSSYLLKSHDTPNINTHCMFNQENTSHAKP